LQREERSFEFAEIPEGMAIAPDPERARANMKAMRKELFRCGGRMQSAALSPAPLTASLFLAC
jgi:hypothetical protein